MVELEIVVLYVQLVQLCTVCTVSTVPVTEQKLMNVGSWVLLLCDLIHDYLLSSYYVLSLVLRALT